MSENLYQLVRQRAATYPAAVAVGSQQGLTWKTLTSQQLLERVDVLAEELRARMGIESGDRIVRWVPSTWRAPVYLFAPWKLGAIIVPFDREMNSSAASKIIQSVEPRPGIVGYDDRPPWCADLANLVEWWEPGVIDTSDPSAIDRATATDEDVALIVFTSGTTGNPKGCVITHANLWHQVRVLRRPTSRRSSPGGTAASPSTGRSLPRRGGLSQTAARHFANRLLTATSANRYGEAGAFAMLGTLLFGLYPIQQHHGQSASLRGLARLAAGGNALLIFPAGGIPVAIARGPLAIAFGPPLRRGPDEEPAAFAARLERTCFALARRAKETLASGGRKGRGG